MSERERASDTPSPAKPSPSRTGTMSKLFDLAKGVTRDASTLSERLSRDASHVSEETPARVSSDEPRAAEPDVWAERFAKTESFYQRVGIKAGGEAGVEESVQEMETIARRLHKLSSDPSTHAAFRSKGGITALAGEQPSTPITWA